jgi:hypothetical protein
MTLHQFREGFGDQNRDATKAIEAALQAAYGRDDLWCTYSPAEATQKHPAGVIIRVHLVTDTAKHRMEALGAVHFPLDEPFEIAEELETISQSMVCPVEPPPVSPEKPSGT